MARTSGPHNNRKPYSMHNHRDNQQQQPKDRPRHLPKEQTESIQGRLDFVGNHIDKLRQELARKELQQQDLLALQAQQMGPSRSRSQSPQNQKHSKEQSLGRRSRERSVIIAKAEEKAHRPDLRVSLDKKRGRHPAPASNKREVSRSKRDRTASPSKEEKRSKRDRTPSPSKSKKDRTSSPVREEKRSKKEDNPPPAREDSKAKKERTPSPSSPSSSSEDGEATSSDTSEEEEEENSPSPAPPPTSPSLKKGSNSKDKPLNKTRAVGIQCGTTDTPRQPLKLHRKELEELDWKNLQDNTTLDPVVCKDSLVRAHPFEQIYLYHTLTFWRKLVRAYTDPPVGSFHLGEPVLNPAANPANPAANPAVNSETEQSLEILLNEQVDLD